MRAGCYILAGLVAAAVLTACKREMPISAARPPRQAETSVGNTKELNLAKLRAEFEEIPALGSGINYVDPDDKEKEIWTRYPSGFMIRELKTSDGEIPRLGQTVSIAYTGKLYPSGKIFDQRGADNPLTFRLGTKSIVKGFNLGVSTMKLGGKRRVFIPSDLAYGPAGNPMGGIGPNQPLIFEIELLKIQGEAISLAEDFVMPQPLGPNLPATTSAPATSPAAH